jgi:hypothetical protein
MRTALLILASATSLLVGCETTERVLGSGSSEPDYDRAVATASEGKDKTVDAREAQQYGITEPAFHHASRGSNQPLDAKGLERALKYQFDKSDMNRDGRLDRGEAVAAGLKSARVFDQGNRDDDRTLNLSEYVRGMTAQASAPR